MDDDPFADLFPTSKPKPAASPGPLIEEDNVLPAQLDDDAQSVGQATQAAMDAVFAPAAGGSSSAKGSSPMSSPMGEPRGKRELRDLEQTTQALVEAAMRKFAGGLTKVLEDMNRRVAPRCPGGMAVGKVIIPPRKLHMLPIKDRNILVLLQHQRTG